MEQPISISHLNDYIFCPVSIYFHGLYGDYSRMLMQNTDQRNGSFVHEKIDFGGYSSKKDILTGISVYSERFNLIGKIDCYDRSKKELIERKKQIKVIYDGYVFQLYGQYFALTEMGYPVKKLFLYSYDQNKKYSVKLPQEDIAMYEKFKDTVASVQAFSVENFKQTNREKCLHCIYEPLCDRSLV